MTERVINKCVLCAYEMADADFFPCNECYVSTNKFVPKHAITTNEKLDEIIALLTKLFQPPTVIIPESATAVIKEAMERGQTVVTPVYGCPVPSAKISVDWETK